jgi:hypothetical protein
MSTETNARNVTLEAVEQANKQVRDFGERATGTSRAFGQLTLDAYEQAVTNFVEFEHKAAEATPVEWVKAALGAHASFVEELTGAYVRAARSLLERAPAA